MKMDHNICLGGVDGRCQIFNYVNGKPNWNAYKPGEHGDHNIVDRRGPAGSLSVSIPLSLSTTSG